MNEGRSPTLIFEQRSETREIANPALYKQLIQETTK
jgi:hypothetical protein